MELPKISKLQYLLVIVSLVYFMLSIAFMVRKEIRERRAF